MQKLMENRSSDKSISESKHSRSFTLFFILVIGVMILTGWLGIVDVWYGDITEQTSVQEEKVLNLTEDLKVVLGENSKLTFHKGEEDDLRLDGYAEMEVTGASTEVEVETWDLTLEVREANFWVDCRDSTTVGIISGELIVYPKSDSESIPLSGGEQYSYLAKGER